MISRSGLSEGLDIALHHRKPIDAMELGDWLMIDLGPILDAQSTIWLFGNEALISGASEVVLAAGDVMAKSTALAESQKAGEVESVSDRIREIKRRFRPLPRDADAEAALQSSVHSLGIKCREFGQVMRRHVGTPDPAALLRSFPEAGAKEA
jgi:hypothetical protein